MQMDTLYDENDKLVLPPKVIVPAWVQEFYEIEKWRKEHPGEMYPLSADFDGDEMNIFLAQPSVLQPENVTDDSQNVFPYFKTSGGLMELCTFVGDCISEELSNLDSDKLNVSLSQSPQIKTDVDVPVTLDTCTDQLNTYVDRTDDGLYLRFPTIIAHTIPTDKPGRIII